MALTKFTTSMDIIAALDDEPNDIGGLSAAQLKATFDESGNAIKAYINETLTVEADATFATKAEVQSVVLGQFPDGTITDAKLSTEVNAEIDGKAAGNHIHGNITNDGKIGSTADLMVVTTTDGAVTTKTVADTKTLLGVENNLPKLLTVTVATAAASISLDLSGADTSLYSELIIDAELFTSAGGAVNCTINNLGSPYYYGAYIKESSTIVTSFSGVANFGAFPTAGTGSTCSSSNPIHLKINNSFLNIGKATTVGYCDITYSGGVQSGHLSGTCGIYMESHVTSVQFIAASGTIMAGSKFYVYGVKK